MIWDKVIYSIPTLFDLLALTMCIGALGCRLWVIPPAARAAGGGDSQDILNRLWLLLAICIAVLVFSSISLLLVRAVEMSGYPLKAVLPILPTVLSKTHFGQAWLVRIAALGGLGVGWFSGRQRLDSRAVPALMLIAAGVIAMTRSASGHAAGEGDFRLPELMDWLHLMGASFWGGGLLVLSTFLVPLTIKRVGREPTLIAHISHRFSFVAGVALGTIVVTATYNAWRQVGSLKALLETQYGRTIIAKLLLLLGLVILGALNRYINLPLLRQRAGKPLIRRGFLYSLLTIRCRASYYKEDVALVARRFLWNVRLGAIFIVGALLCAALLLHEVPARHFSHAQYGHSMKKATINGRGEVNSCLRWGERRGTCTSGL